METYNGTEAKRPGPVFLIGNKLWEDRDNGHARQRLQSNP